MRALDVLAAAAAFLIAGCAGPPGAPNAPAAANAANAADGPLAHVVAFWFKAGAPTDAARWLVEAYRRDVAAVPGVRSVFAGRPLPRAAGAAARPMVDASYDVLTVVTFEGPERAAAWQDHPLHQQLRARFDPFLDKILVYDAR